MDIQAIATEPIVEDGHGDYLHPTGGVPERSLTMLLYAARNWSMEYRRIQWDRETLYKAVWEKSSVQVAREFGISDVALAKICRKLKVPNRDPGIGGVRNAGIRSSVHRFCR